MMSCLLPCIVCKFFKLNGIMDGFVDLFIKVRSCLIVAVQIVSFFFFITFMLNMSPSHLVFIVVVVWRLV